MDMSLEQYLLLPMFAFSNEEMANRVLAQGAGMVKRYFPDHGKYYVSLPSAARVGLRADGLFTGGGDNQPLTLQRRAVGDVVNKPKGSFYVARILEGVHNFALTPSFLGTQPFMHECYVVWASPDGSEISDRSEMNETPDLMDLYQDSLIKGIEYFTIAGRGVLYSQICWLGRDGEVMWYTTLFAMITFRINAGRKAATAPTIEAGLTWRFEENGEPDIRDLSKPWKKLVRRARKRYRHYCASNRAILTPEQIAYRNCQLDMLAISYAINQVVPDFRPVSRNMFGDVIKNILMRFRRTVPLPPRESLPAPGEYRAWVRKHTFEQAIPTVQEPWQLAIVIQENIWNPGVDKPPIDSVAHIFRILLGSLDEEICSDERKRQIWAMFALISDQFHRSRKKEVGGDAPTAQS